MPTPEQPSPERLERASELLRERLGGDPSVTLIDVGLDPSSQGAEGTPVLRAHFRTKDDIDRLHRAGRLPSEILGVHVIAIVADYRLDDGSCGPC